MTAKPAAGRPDFERIALLLQGGGTLGSCQADLYEALAEADLHPDWVVGISIGAINAALIAGNPPERRVERLRAFWETVTRPPLGMPSLPSVNITSDLPHQMINQFRAMGIMPWGAPDFFTPRIPPPIVLAGGNPGNLAFYEISPLKALLERLVDFDLINAKQTRFSVGAGNIETGNLTYFDNMTHNVGPAHVMASCSLPPGTFDLKAQGRE